MVKWVTQFTKTNIISELKLTAARCFKMEAYTSVISNPQSNIACIHDSTTHNQILRVSMTIHILLKAFFAH